MNCVIYLKTLKYPSKWLKFAVSSKKLKHMLLIACRLLDKGF